MHDGEAVAAQFERDAAQAGGRLDLAPTREEPVNVMKSTLGSRTSAGPMVSP